MYESEVNKLTGSASSVPEHVRGRFLEVRKTIAARSQLPWGEHCTECNWPTCYTSCELYTPREDGACRLFHEGMVRLDLPGAANGYLLRARFKQWGKLYAEGSWSLRTLVEADRRERVNRFVGAAARNVPMPGSIKKRVLGKVSYLRRQSAQAGLDLARLPDAFVFECYNPNDRPVDLTFSVSNRTTEPVLPFQHVIRAAPGYVRARIPLSDILGRIDASKPFALEIVPNNCRDLELIFGLMDFVRDAAGEGTAAGAGTPAKKCKCVVWDLDNTLWDGTLIEDGADGVKLRTEVVETIRGLDRRGVLNSIASKNNPDEAMAVVERFGLKEFFLCPQVSWAPKSGAIRSIAEALNIGLDTFLFIDDQEFERAEVAAVHPEVRVIDASEAAALLTHEACDVPVTEDSKKRRVMYQQKQRRDVAGELFGGDYFAFLRQCNIRMELHSLRAQDVDRVYELAQRTNQMNFSGNRYPRERLHAIMRDTSKSTYVLRVDDRFGSYGIVGFCLVDTQGPRLLDLMFSCRVQSKRIEHAFLSYLIKKHAKDGKRDFFVNYRKTEKNESSGRVFTDFAFTVEGEHDGVTLLKLPRGAAIPDDRIVAIKEGDRNDP